MEQQPLWKDPYIAPPRQGLQYSEVAPAAPDN